MTSHRFQPRRTRVQWWLPTLALLLAVAWAFNSLVRTSRTETATADQLHSHTITLDRAARSFVRLIEQIDALDRSDLDSMIIQSRDSLEAVGAALREETGPDSNLTTLLRLCIDLWDDGLESFEEAFLSAVGDPFNFIVEEQLIAALVNLRSGDHLYRAFLEETASNPDVSLFSDFRTVVFLPNQYPVVASHPEWISDLEGRPVIIPTDSFDLLVVVANRGNAQGPEETLLELSIWPPGETIQTRVLEVPSLQPGEKTTVTFYELAVAPDTSYQVEVRLSYIDGDQSPEDNSYGFTLQVSS